MRLDEIDMGIAERIMTLIELEQKEHNVIAQEYIDKIRNEYKQERKQYQALVDAAVAFYQWRQWAGNPDMANKETRAVMDAAKQFMKPSPSIADRLDALADGDYYSGQLESSLRAIAAELREKHGGGE